MQIIDILSNQLYHTWFSIVYSLLSDRGDKPEFCNLYILNNLKNLRSRELDFGLRDKMHNGFILSDCMLIFIS